MFAFFVFLTFIVPFIDGFLEPDEFLNNVAMRTMWRECIGEENAAVFEVRVKEAASVCKDQIFDDSLFRFEEDKKSGLVESSNSANRGRSFDSYDNRGGNSGRKGSRRGNRRRRNSGEENDTGDSYGSFGNNGDDGKSEDERGSRGEGIGRRNGGRKKEEEEEVGEKGSGRGLHNNRRNGRRSNKDRGSRRDGKRSSRRNRDRDTDRGSNRDRDADRGSSRDRGRKGTSNRENGRSNGSRRSKNRNKSDRGRDSNGNIDSERDRNKDRDTDRESSRDRNKSRSKGNDRDRDRKRSQGKDRDRDRDRGQGKVRNRNRSRGTSGKTSGYRDRDDYDYESRNNYGGGYGNNNNDDDYEEQDGGDYGDYDYEEEEEEEDYDNDNDGGVTFSNDGNRDKPKSGYPKGHIPDDIKPVYFTLIDQIPFLLQGQGGGHFGYGRKKRQVNDFRKLSIQELIDGEDRVKTQLSNFSCILDSLDLMGQNGEVRINDLLAELDGMDMSSQLREDLQKGINDCARLTACLPEDENDRFLPRKLQQAIFFFKCNQKRRQVACYKKEIDDYLSETIPQERQGSFDQASTVNRVLYIKMENTFKNLQGIL